MTTYYRNGAPFAPSPAVAAAYRALAIAADRIGGNMYAAGIRAHVRAGRKASTYRYTPTAVHRTIVDAMPRVLAGTITPEAAMALLHHPETLRERFPLGENSQR